MIKPEFWDDEKLSKISRDARLTFIGLWNHSDDYGVVKGHPVWLRNKIFPYDSIKPDAFVKWLNELQKINCIISFSHHGESYLFIRRFLEHQKVNRPSQIRNPEPPDNILMEPSMSPPDNLIDETETETEVKQKPKQKQKPRESVSARESTFIEFWNAYPKKKAKGQAQKTWGQLWENNTLPAMGAILDAINAQKESPDWNKEGGQFIPHPSTWLNAQGWDDQIEVEVKGGNGKGKKRIDREEWIDGLRIDGPVKARAHMIDKAGFDAEDVDRWIAEETKNGNDDTKIRPGR